MGHFTGNFVGDMAIFGGAYRVGKGSVSIGSRFTNVTKKIGVSEKNTSQSSIVTEGILFGQKNVGKTFSNGDFQGMSIDKVVAGLRNGQFSPNQLPINYLIKNGKMVTFNNRSLLTLRRAKLEPTILKDVTGNPFFEEKLIEHLQGFPPKFNNSSKRRASRYFLGWSIKKYEISYFRYPPSRFLEKRL